MIKVNLNDINEIRDYKIDQLLDSYHLEPKNNIEVSVRYGNRGNREFETFKYNIIR
jgi:hypothetical protein